MRPGWWHRPDQSHHNTGNSHCEIEMVTQIDPSWSRASYQAGPDCWGEGGDGWSMLHWGSPSFVRPCLISEWAKSKDVVWIPFDCAVRRDWDTSSEVWTPWSYTQISQECHRRDCQWGSIAAARCACCLLLLSQTQTSVAIFSPLPLSLSLESSALIRHSSHHAICKES